jgi:glutamate-1-semialdehyde 2,1-aminomutase
MQHLSPLGPVYQAGTLSGNPLAMAAGLRTLELLNDEAYDQLEHLGALLEEKVQHVLEKHNMPMRLVRLGSLFWFSPGSQSPPSRSDMIPKDAAALYADVHHGLLERGYMLAPSAYEIGFIATAHEEHHITGMVDALDDVLLTMRDQHER